MEEKQYLVSESKLIQKIMGMRFLDTTDEKIEQIKDFLKSKQPVQKLDRDRVEKIVRKITIKYLGQDCLNETADKYFNELLDAICGEGK